MYFSRVQSCSHRGHNSFELAFVTINDSDIRYEATVLILSDCLQMPQYIRLPS